MKAVRRMREEAERARGSGQKEGGIQLPSAHGQLYSFWVPELQSNPEPLSFLFWPYIARFHISWQPTQNGTQAKRSEDCILVRTSFPCTESVAAWHAFGITAVRREKGAEEERVCVWYSLSCPVSARGGSGGKGNAEVEAKAIGTERRA